VRLGVVLPTFGDICWCGALFGALACVCFVQRCAHLGESLIGVEVMGTKGILEKE
jgi:hypothetical protein